MKQKRIARPANARTGLDATKDVIVEIATIVTDDELNVVAEGPDLVIYQSDEALATMDKVVVDMHTRSGLLDAIKASTVSLEDAGAQTLAFIKEHVPVQSTVPLCGNSIGMALAVRNLMTDLRSSGEVTGGPRGFSPRDRSAFLSALDQTIRRIKRAQTQTS